MPFEEFVATRLTALLRYAVVLSGDRELARDMVQEVLARALVRWRRITAAGDPYAYVRKMLTNEYLALRRRRTVLTVPLTERTLDGPGTPAAPEPAMGAADSAELWRLVAALPRQQRAAVVLRYYEDLTDLEIADVLGCRPATVRGYVTRALAALRVEINDLSHTGGAAS